MKPPIPKLKLQFRVPSGAMPSVALQLRELFLFAKSIEPDHPSFATWYLSSATSPSDALRTPAFDAAGPTADALAELAREENAANDIRGISLWNGAMGRGEGAMLENVYSSLGRPNSFEFGLKLVPEVTAWSQPARWLATAVSIWPTALYASFAPLWHSERRIFQDRPGVGWMIYLPRAITAAQVPEARQLVPVNAPDGSPRGTIVVSVTEGGYSDDNPEHLATAQAIETRLVDLDLLPRFADL
jgi:hypothetical protein